VDISNNPIGPLGAHHILESLLESNESLASLGDLSNNSYMGVRNRENIRQILELNLMGPEKKRRLIESNNLAVMAENPAERNGESVKQEKLPPSNLEKEMEYPLLQPIAFTNPIQDDYLNLGVWNLKA